jgi:hypothetical protein
MRAARRILLGVVLVLVCVPVLTVQAAAASDTTCSPVLGNAVVGGPTNAVVWRVGIEAPTAVFSSLSGRSMRIMRWVASAEAPWLLVTARARAADSRCWLQVRLPWRPNGSAGWINANKVVLERTRGAS